MYSLSDCHGHQYASKNRITGFSIGGLLGMARVMVLVGVGVEVEEAEEEVEEEGGAGGVYSGRARMVRT